MPFFVGVWLVLWGGLLLNAPQARAQARLAPAALTGFTADVIADGTNRAVADVTNADFDGFSFVLMQNGFSTSAATATVGAPASGYLPGGTTTGFASPQVPFQLASAGAVNSLRMSGTGTSALTLSTPVRASAMYVLVSGGGGGTTATITVNYASGSPTTFADLSVNDWYDNSGFAATGLGRTQRGATGIDNNTSNPRLYQLNLTGLDQTRRVTSVSINKTNANAILNVMAVTLNAVEAQIGAILPATNARGGVLTLTGINLAGATAVGFAGGATAVPTVNQAGTSLTVTVPATAQTGNVTVTTPSGTTNALTLTIGAYATAAVAGFNQDVIADGVGTTLVRTTVSVDGGNDALLANGFHNSLSATTNANLGFPLTRIISSAATAGLPFQLAPYDQNNSLRSDSGNPSLSLTGQPNATEIKLLTTSGGGNASRNITVTYAGGFSETFNNVVTPDWFSSSPTAPVASSGTLGRVNRTNNTISNTDQPKLYELTLTPSPANLGRPVTALQFGGGGSMLNVLAVSVRVPGVPTLTNLSTTTGAPGNTVTLTGTNFTGNATVSFNGTAATSITVTSATSLTATVPTGATTGNITVTTPGGTTGGLAFTVPTAPFIGSFTPSSGAAGTAVTLTGTDLNTVTGVYFGTGLTTQITSQSATSLTVLVPLNASTGSIIVVNNRNQPATTGTVGFTFTPAPLGLAATLAPAGPLDVCQPRTLTASATTAVLNIGTGFNNEVRSAAVLPDGDVVVVGNFTAYNGTTRNRVVRLNADGSLDNGFSVGTGFNGFVTQVARQADGKLLIVGNFTDYNGTAVNRVVRLNADGSRDASFNVGTGLNNFAYALALQADGKVLVGGEFSSYNGTAVTRMARLNTDGSLDASFSANPVGSVYVLAVQPDGKVLAGGTVWTDGTPSRLARYNADGSRDVSFAIGSGFSGAVWSIAVQPDGKVLVGGNYTTFQSQTANALVRLHADGSLDTGFNIGTGLTFGSFASNVNALALRPDGTVWVGGSFTAYNGTPVGNLVRLTSTGGPDPTFSACTGFNSSVLTLLALPTGRVLAGGGFSAYNGTNVAALARLTAAGPLDNTGTALTGATFTFSPGSTTTNPLTTSTPGAYSVTATLDGLTSAPSNSVTLTSCPQPLLFSIAPANATIGTTLTLTGSTFVGVTGVTFAGSGTTTAFTVNSTTELTVTVPAGTRTGSVTVTAAGGTSNTAFLYVIPTVAGVSPLTGPPGTTVTITGTGLSDVTTVRMGPPGAGPDGLNPQANAAGTQLTFQVPVDAVSGTLELLAGPNAVTTTQAFVAVPVLRQPPNYFATAGQSITFQGINLDNASSLTINGVSSPITASTSTSVTVTVPATATTGMVTVTTPAGQGTFAQPYGVGATITGFAPAEAAPGATVTVTGTGFSDGSLSGLNSVFSVQAGDCDMPSTFTVVSATQLTFVVPADACTGAAVRLGGPGSPVGPGTFVVLPTISSFAPASGPVGAVVSVTVTGNTNVATAAFAFNGVAATTVSQTGSRTYDVTVPAGATTGPISFTTTSVTGSLARTGTSAAVFTVNASFALTGRTPVRNAISAPVGTSIGLTFSAPVQPSTAADVRVFSAQRGGQLVRGGNATAGGNTLTVDPAQNLRPGETVFVTVPATVTGTAGGAAVKQVYQFTTGVSPTSPGVFTGTTSVSVGNTPVGVVAADVNSDGHLDLLTTNNATGINTMSVRLGDGLGGFSGTTDVGVGSRPSVLTAADVNNDGHLDVLVGNLSASTVSVLLGDGTSAFSAAADVPVNGPVANVAAADVNADGFLDLLTPNGATNGLSVRLGNGAGGFSGTTTVAVGGNPCGVAAADVNGDGHLDLLVTNNTSNTVSVRLGDGSGTAFTGSTNVAVGNGPFGVVATDVNNDGFVDCITSNQISNSASVRLGDGAGGFSGTTEVAVGGSARALQVADINGDGHLDILTANTGSGTVSVRLGDGSGAFSGTTNVATGGNVRALAVADLDNDGDLDLLATNANATGTVNVRLNQLAAPSVTTAAAGSLTATSATLGGNVTASGGASVTGRGVVYSATATVPAIGGVGVVQQAVGTGTGTFSQTVSGLAPGTLYYVRAYATNSVGTSYGVVRTFSTLALPNQTPTDLSLSNAAVAENAANALVGLLTTADPDAADTHTYQLVSGVGSTGNAAFTIVGDELRVGATGLDFESQASYAVRVRSTDNGTGNLSFERSFTISVLDVAEPLTVSTTAAVPSGFYSTLTVTGTGVATLSGPVQVSDAVVVQSGGALVTACQPLTGAGTFTLQAGATLSICSPQGISGSGVSGAVQVSGTRTFDPDAIYVYTGTAAQVTGDGLPATVRRLESTNAQPLTLSQNLSIRQALVLGTGNVLTVGRTLVLLSDATGSAYAANTGSGVVVGTVTVQRWVGAPAAVSYRHISSPVQAAPVSDLTTTAYTPRVNAAYNVLPAPALSAAAFPTIFGYDETRGGTTAAFQGFNTGYQSPTALSSILTPGRGWTAYLTGNQTPDFVGTLTTGPVSMPLTLTGTPTTSNKAGWALVGNPYPQPIDANLLALPAGVQATVFVWYSTGGANGAYRTAATLPGGLIGIGQGFWVRRTGGTSPVSLDFTNAVRATDNAVGLGRATAAAQRPSLTLTLAQTGRPTDEADALTVLAQPGATPGADAAFDALRPAPNVGLPTLSALVDGQEAAISALSESVLTGAETVVELTLTLPATGQYTLAPTQAQGWGATSVELLDRLTNTRYDLTQPLTLPLTARQANQTVAGRFAVVLNGGRVLGTAADAATSALALFPNPAVRGGAVRITGCRSSQPLAVLDLTGRTVATATADATGTATLATRGLAAGTYVLRTPDGRTTRLVVE